MEKNQKYEKLLESRLNNRYWCTFYADSYSNPNMEKAKSQALKEFNLFKKIDSLGKKKKKSFYNSLDKILLQKYLSEELKEDDYLMVLDINNLNFFEKGIDISKEAENLYKKLFG